MLFIKALFFKGPYPALCIFDDKKECKAFITLNYTYKTSGIHTSICYI